jgi:hypothetical protein
LLDTGVFHMMNVPYTLLNPTAGITKPTGLDSHDLAQETPLV